MPTYAVPTPTTSPRLRRQHPHSWHLEFRGQRLTDAKLEQLAKRISYCAGVIAVCDLADNAVGDKGCIALVSALQATAAALAASRTAPRANGGWAGSVCFVDQLSFGSTAVGDVGAGELAALVADGLVSSWSCSCQRAQGRSAWASRAADAEAVGLPPIVSLPAALNCTFAPGCVPAPPLLQLRSALDLSKCRVGSLGVRALGSALPLSTTLTSLDLSGNTGVDPAAAAGLAQGLAGSALRWLDLSHTAVGDDGATLLAGALCGLTTAALLDGPPGMPMAVAGNGAGAAAGGRGTSSHTAVPPLQHLRLQHAGIADRGAAALAAASQRGSHLRVLELDGNSIGVVGATALAVATMGPLPAAAAAERTARGLAPIGCGLQHLGLSRCRVGPEGGLAFAAMVRTRTRADAAAAAAKPGGGHAPALTSLALSSNSAMGAAAAVLLAAMAYTHWPELVVDLAGVVPPAAVAAAAGIGGGSGAAESVGPATAMTPRPAPLLTAAVAAALSLARGAGGVDHGAIAPDVTEAVCRRYELLSALTEPAAAGAEAFKPGSARPAPTSAGGRRTSRPDAAAASLTGGATARDGPSRV
jgi:hypothetical protein